MKTMLVELKPRAERRYSVSLIFSKRRWWPVYKSCHRDPSLGPVGAQPHYHIALNRLPERFIYRHWRLLGILVIPGADILGYHPVNRPIISGPWVPAPTKQQRLDMIAEYKRRKPINKR